MFCSENNVDIYVDRHSNIKLVKESVHHIVVLSEKKHEGIVKLNNKDD